MVGHQSAESIREAAKKPNCPLFLTGYTRGWYLGSILI